ncbi:MAG: polyprenyl synthetase family protein [Bacteroidetes bacterium]|nr:polyprenyl synthetase family protein [Bacteroidota bacterium]
MVKEVQNKIDEEIKKLFQELSISPVELYEPIRYMLSLGGKRIRPLFVLLANDLFEGKTEDAIPAALAIELFHNFTLVHDDIMDNAPLRRNQPTVHQKWNSSSAILSGDVMLVKAFQLLSESTQFEIIFPVFSEMAVKVCEGQQFDLNYEQLNKISVPQYFKMIELKTAVLFAASMKIGALTGKTKANDAENIYEFGKNIGMAFQLRDDLLDVYGEEEKFGKQKGGDIISNKKTFLLLKAIELSGLNSYKKEELVQWLEFNPKNEKDSKEKVEAVKSIYDFCNVKKITGQEINSFHQKAIASLDKVSASEEKMKVLIEFTSSLLSREA